jgi:F-type H+-transporting ATPase subunit delta
MQNVSVARRYARALLEVSAEAGTLDKVSAQLDAVSKLLGQLPELQDLLTNPAHPRSARSEVMEKIIASTGLDSSTGNLLRLLVERNRTGYLPDIARLFRDMADTRSGRLRGLVSSPIELPAELMKKLESSLQALTQRNVVLESKVDKSLIGGATAQVGSVIYDGSLRSQLLELRRLLKSR